MGNAFSPIGRTKLPPFLSKLADGVSPRVAALAGNVVGPAGKRILVRVAGDEYAAAFLSSRGEGTLSAHWRDGTGSWQPEPAFRRLQGLAHKHIVDLQLPPDMVLSNTVRLPKAALANLSDAVAYGLPSWSPFQTGDVYVSARPDGVRGEQVLVRIHYAPRSKVDPILARLDSLGLAADRVSMDPSACDLIDLATPKMAGIRRARRLDGTLAALAVALSLLAGCVHVAALSRRLDETEAALRFELAQVRDAESLQRQYALFVARRAAVSERRAHEIGAYELLAALARSLPDGTLIQTLDMGDGRVRLEVSGADPDAMVQALRTTPSVRDPKVEPARGSRAILLSFGLARKNP
jgi:hypothetical protein